MMNWSQEDIKLVEKFIEIKNKGYYVDGGQVTDVYNRVLDKRVNVTNCGSCIRGRIQELQDALNRFKEICKRQEELAQEQLKNDEVGSNTPEENKATVDEKKRPGRPKKS